MRGAGEFLKEVYNSTLTEKTGARNKADEMLLRELSPDVAHSDDNKQKHKRGKSDNVKP